MKKIEEVQYINDKLFIDGYQFYKHRDNIVRCSQHTLSHCKVKVNKIDNGEEYVYYYREGNKSTHTHPLDKNVYKKALLYEDLDRIILTRDETVTNLVKSAFENNDIDPDDNDILSLKAAVNYVYKKERIKRDKKNDSVKVEDYFIGRDDGVTVYGDKGLIDFFKGSNVLFCDGTFEKKRSLFKYYKD